jgi:putative phosphoesterase
VFAAFEGVDLILHAGDLNTLQVIGDLETIAPVVAVHGNNDDWEAMHRLDTTQRLVVEDCVIGLVHGDVAASPSVRPLGGAPGNNQTAAYALSHFPDADCVVFGHSHWPLLQWLELAARPAAPQTTEEQTRHVLLLNPGSACKKRRAPNHTCALLRVDGKRLEAEIIAW